MTTNVQITPRKPSEVEVAYLKSDKNIFLVLDDAASTVSVDLSVEIANYIIKQLKRAVKEVNENACNSQSASNG